jgi:ammonium transporter, Amt family
MRNVIQGSPPLWKDKWSLTSVRRVLCGIAAVVCLMFAPMLVSAQPTTAPTEAAVATVTAAAAPVEAKYDTGSIAWMLTSTALVLLMVPGLALFYGGMVRSKNVLNTFLLCMAPIGIIGLQWVILGYAIAFPVVSDTNVIFGGSPSEGAPIVSYLAFDKALLFLSAFNPATYGNPVTSGDTTGAVSTKVPELVFLMFQGKFAIITPALIVGAVVERVRFGPMMVFMFIWSTVIYAPVAHWVWNVNGWLFQKGVLDYAGGTVVHILGGFSALALCLVVGPRKGYGQVAMPPHSLGLTLIGAGLLWFGWFGFNAGSTIGAPGADVMATGGVSGALAGLAFTNTQIAAAAAATAWMLTEWVYAGKPTILGFASGMVAGLVVITPCAGFVLPWHSIVIGGAGGVLCFFACKIKNIIKADDSLDAFGVHGVGGVLGAILVGVFAFRGVSDGLIMKQVIAVVVSAGFAFVGSLIIAFAIAKTIGLRAKAADEEDGLDIALHGEQGYHLGYTSGSLMSGETEALDARATTAANPARAV